MTAVGVARSERGGRTDEYLDAMTALWTQQAPAYHGRYVDFGHVDAHPRPVLSGGLRIVVGGHSPAAFRRAVARGHGWFGNGRTPDLVNHLAGLRKAHGPHTWAGWRSPSCRSTRWRWTPPDAARRYADRLLICPLPLEDPDKVAAFGRAARQPLSTLTSIEPNISPLLHSLFINSSSVDT
jgi:hypothetical protein